MSEHKCGVSEVWENHCAHGFGAPGHADLADLHQLLHGCVSADLQGGRVKCERAKVQGGVAVFASSPAQAV